METFFRISLGLLALGLVIVYFGAPISLLGPLALPVVIAAILLDGEEMW